ncbi:MAG: hypothetical protein ACP59X_02650 [Solidesulfovibrio sp. DCME]|uniref:hypothetical protein n=1 Tax=Solidesulfovibrio sp. DCME TaxID=3447380 RepID=UPI003D0FCAF9
MKHAHPPLAAFVCAIGATGHRHLPPERIAGISQAVAEVLATVRRQVGEALAAAPRGLFPSDRPVVRCVSPLAEGADRIIAQQALAQGYDLQAPLPFFQEDYARDFADAASREAFEGLLKQASAVLELDGSRAPEEEPYLAVGRVVLEQSDLLLAVWDGTMAKGRGGTGQIVSVAAERGLPVLVVDPTDPTAIRFHGACECGDWREALGHCLRRLVLPPPPTPDKGPQNWKDRLKDWFTGGVSASTSPAQYFAEARPRPSVLEHFPVWFERALARTCNRRREPDAAVRAGWRGRLAALRAGLPGLCGSRTARPDGPSAAAAHGWCDALGLGRPEARAAEALVAEHYRWADVLAVQYGARYRAMGFLRHLLMAVVMVGVFFGFYVERLEALGFGVEVLAFAAILMLVRLNTRSNWHQRFLDYRSLAEQFRHLRFLFVLGCVPAFAQEGLDAACIRKSWTGWHLRNVARQAGLAWARMEPPLLEAYRSKLDADVLREQMAFYKDRRKRYAVIARRLNAFGIWCFIVGLGFIALRCLVFWWVKGDTALVLGYKGSNVRTALNVIALVIPSLASMAFAIRAQGEYVALGAQYAKARDTLADRRHALEALTGLTRNKLAKLSEKLAATMTSEVSGWHGLVKGKALRPW